MTRNEAVQFIRSTSGKIFAVKFVKRTTGELRIMNCRTGVVSHLRGELGSGPAYDAREKGLVTVFDMSRNGYRSIPIEGITEIKVGGDWQAVS